MKYEIEFKTGAYNVVISGDDIEKVIADIDYILERLNGTTDERIE